MISTNDCVFAFNSATFILSSVCEAFRECFCCWAEDCTKLANTAINNGNLLNETKTREIYDSLLCWCSQLINWLRDRGIQMRKFRWKKLCRWREWKELLCDCGAVCMARHHLFTRLLRHMLLPEFMNTISSANSKRMNRPIFVIVEFLLIRFSFLFISSALNKRNMYCEENYRKLKAKEIYECKNWSQTTMT